VIVKLAVRGVKLDVVFIGHDREVFDTLSGLDDPDRAAVYALMQMLADTARIMNTQRFKKVEGTGLWEFKQRAHRFIGFYLRGRFAVVAYEFKQANKLSKTIIERATRIQEELKKNEKKAIEEESARAKT